MEIGGENLKKLQLSPLYNYFPENNTSENLLH